MLYDYLRSVFRSFMKNKLFTLINIGGLALGLAVFFALALYIDYETSFDKQWRDAERIYRLNGVMESENGNSPITMTNSPYALRPALEKLFPASVETYVRVYRRGNNMLIKGEKVESPILLAEPAILDLLQIDALEGSMQAVFDDPHAIALGENWATKYYGTQSPLGSTISVSVSGIGLVDYIVKAVYRSPEPTSLPISSTLALLDTSALPEQAAGLETWERNQQSEAMQVLNVLKLKAGVDTTEIDAGLRAYMDQNNFLSFGGDSKIRFSLQPLPDVHFSPYIASGNSVQRLLVFAVIGLLVLMISGCNFILLTTVKSVDRMREVGIRKALGSQVGQLVQHYLLDAFCQTLLAGILAVALLELALPQLQVLLQTTLTIHYTDVRKLGFFLAIVTGFALLSGTWPALQLARGKPGMLLQNNSEALVASGNMLRKLLVGFQFAIVILLLLGSAVVRQQIDYMQHRDRGFDLQNVLQLIAFTPEVQKQSATLAQEFSRLTGVSSAGISSVPPNVGLISTPATIKSLTDDKATKEAKLTLFGMGYDYFKTINVKVLAGREFAEGLDELPSKDASEQYAESLIKEQEKTPPTEKAIINSVAAHAFGFSEPESALDQLLEQEFQIKDGKIHKKSYRIIGVVADTQFSSVMLPPQAELYTLAAGGNFIALKLAPTADIAAVKRDMESIWHQHLGTALFSPIFADEAQPNFLRREENEARIVTLSTVIALIIALLGLYALVAATVAKRLKEIGVRKTLGASVGSLVRLLLWQFSKPILIANVVAWPLGLWGASLWLQRFPFQLQFSLIIGTAVVASVFALLIAWATVGWMAAKAASQKPVLALRYE